MLIRNSQKYENTSKKEEIRLSPVTQVSIQTGIKKVPTQIAISQTLPIDL